MNKRKNADLTSFAALLGDSFASKINLLAQILQDAHYPSLGRYKEKLLANVLEEYIPNKYQVGTGFVLFAHQASEERSSKPGFDRLNMGSHSVSKQCDIIIYDASELPVVFKDHDFVIVRPESVKAIIEVKGSVNKKAVDKTLDSFYDFGKKWHACQSFYAEHGQQLSRAPLLYAMCWDISKNKQGKPVTDGTKVRELIANYYKKNLDSSLLMGFPVLDSLYIYNECEVSCMVWCDYEDDDKQELSIKKGWSTDSGKFIRYNDEQKPYREGDSTISSLLAGLHCSFEEGFNRFYSYVAETREYTAVPYEHHGFSCWLTDDNDIKNSNNDYVSD